MRAHRTLLALGALFAIASWAGPARAQEALARALGSLPPVIGQSITYQRKGKESIYEIARRHGVSASALYNANQGNLLEGDELLLIPIARIPPLAWLPAAPGAREPAKQGFVVNLTERVLYFYRDGRPERAYPVTIGMRGWETPTGDFTIVNRRKNPTWFPPRWAIEEKPVPPGPDNPLGDRWMGLSAPGYGIHATNVPSSIGRYSSHGCLRTYPEHAHELYELAPIGTPVKIIYQRVVFAYDASAGVVHLAYHPDPYRLEEVRPEAVVRHLEQYGLGQVADVAAVEAALERPTGVPTPVVGSGARLSINGQAVALPLSPVRAGEEWLVPAGPLATALRMRLEVGPRANYAALRRGEQRALFSTGDRDAIINGELVRLEAAPRLAAGHPMIPLRATAGAVGASVGWDAATQTILVWDRHGPGPVGASAAGDTRLSRAPNRQTSL